MSAAESLSEAEASVRDLQALLRDVDADRSITTVEMLVVQVPGSQAELVRRLTGHVGDESWQYFMTGEDKGMAFPVNPKHSGPADPTTVLMTLHTRLVAWWLAQA